MTLARVVQEHLRKELFEFNCYLNQLKIEQPIHAEIWGGCGGVSGWAPVR